MKVAVFPSKKCSIYIFTGISSNHTMRLEVLKREAQSPLSQLVTRSASVWRHLSLPSLRLSFQQQPLKAARHRLYQRWGRVSSAHAHGCSGLAFPLSSLISQMAKENNMFHELMGRWSHTASVGYVAGCPGRHTHTTTGGHYCCHFLLLPITRPNCDIFSNVLIFVHHSLLFLYTFVVCINMYFNIFTINLTWSISTFK